MSAAFKVSMDLYSEISAKNENWRKVYADYAKFRAEQSLWFRFTEASFDGFMQRQKL
jgi:TRAP-type mannitol/chloroaromatic compound transport system substrate-binding protein